MIPRQPMRHSLSRSLSALALVMTLLAPPAALADPDGFNKANLRFNQWFLQHVFEPMGRGWNFILPKWGQRRVGDFMGNLEAPRDILNSVLQGKVRRAGLHTGRFFMNTLFGVVGFYDLAGRDIGWTPPPETLSETFGVWGIPPGNYIVLPVVGEFCTRSLVGWVGDGFTNPISYIPGPPILTVTVGAYVIRNVNLLAQGMPTPWAEQGAWDAYWQSKFKFEPYEVGRDLFYRDEAERVAE
jgi:phospholipid-binding lipoprotein MlaA